MRHLKLPMMEESLVISSNVSLKQTLLICEWGPEVTCW